MKGKVIGTMGNTQSTHKNFYYVEPQKFLAHNMEITWTSINWISKF